jgi:hypothetical protein
VRSRGDSPYIFPIRMERVPLVAGTQRDHWETSYFKCCATGGALRNRATSRADSRNMIFNDFLKQEPTRKCPLSNCFSPRIKLISLYGFDLRAIDLESSILFTVFRPLRTPVPNAQSSDLQALWKALGL